MLYITVNEAGTLKMDDFEDTNVEKDDKRTYMVGGKLRFVRCSFADLANDLSMIVQPENTNAYVAHVINCQHVVAPATHSVVKMNHDSRVLRVYCNTKCVVIVHMKSGANVIINVPFHEVKQVTLIYGGPIVRTQINFDERLILFGNILNR